MGAFEILVIILSIFLALFLLAAIMLAVMLIRVTQQIKRVTNTAERTAGGVEKMVMTLSKASSPLMVLRIVRDQMKKKSSK